MAICFHKEDEQLQDKLEIGIKSTISDTNLACEDAPVVLIVKASDYTDDDKLDGKSRHGYH